MPKESLNIVDFSGGLNSLIDKRDIAENESVFISDLISYNQGSLKLSGLFHPEANSLVDYGLYSESYNSGIDTNFYLEPGKGFAVYGKGTIASTNSTTATITSTNHGLSTGVVINIISVSNGNDAVDTVDDTAEYLGASYTIAKINNNSFSITISEARTLSATWTWVINATVELGEIFSADRIVPDLGNGLNRYILKCDSANKFSFYNINKGYFYGNSINTVQTIGTDPWFFDTEYLWTNRQQIAGDYSEVNYNLTNAYYIDGVFRVNESPPLYWNDGYIKRPVGLYYIEKHKKFNSTITYNTGWYPLASHIMSPTDYQNPADNSFNKSAGTIIGTSVAAASITDPTRTHMVNVGIAQSGSSEGTWQLAGLHSNLGIGISFVYDDANVQDFRSFAQESNISWVTTDGAAYDGTNGKVTVNSGANDKRLGIGLEVKVGHAQGMISPFFNIEDFIPQARGSGISSQTSAWNPRIKAINVYIMADNENVYDDPILLGEWDISEATVSGNTTTKTAYKSFILNDIPAIEYNNIRHGYSHDQGIQKWYKNGVIINRRLYAGNIHYFDDTIPYSKNSDDRITSYPDRIVFSPINRFDILPTDNVFEIAKNDGQEIVKLESFGNALLVFKTSDIFVLDVTTEDAILTNTLYGKGITKPSHVCKSDNYIFFMNKGGVYAFNGESLENLIKDKIDIKLFSESIYTDNNRLLYDPQQNLLIITTSYAYRAAQVDGYTNRALIINVSNGSVFYKNNISSDGISKISNQILVDGELYCTASSTGSNESFTSVKVATGTEGERARATVMIQTTASGSYSTLQSGTTTAGTLNSNAQFIKVKRTFDSAGDNPQEWVTINPLGLSDVNYPIYGGGVSTNKIAFDHYTALADYLNNNLGETGYQDEDYYIHSATVLGTEDTVATSQYLVLVIEAMKNGTTYNFFEEDISSSIHSTYGTTAVAFGSDTTESTNPSTANVNIGNISSFTYTQNNDGVAGVSPSWRVSVDRGGQITTGDTYVITAQRPNFATSTGLRTFAYEVGVDYFIGHPTQTTLDVTTASSNTNNDNLLTNIHNALYYQKLKSSNGNGWQSSVFILGDIAGSSGSKYFDITLKDWVLETFDSLSGFNILTYVDDVALNSGKYYKWTNHLPLDSSNNSLYSSSTIDLETKDIDFGQPGIRKKVYKAYITYKGGDGNIKCQYQANQSGSWTDATVYNASGTASTTAGFLNTSSTPTRAELKFGTGGNNVYSFALRFSSQGEVSIFEVNDLTLIYRLKRPK